MSRINQLFLLLLAVTCSLSPGNSSDPDSSAPTAVATDQIPDSPPATPSTEPVNIDPERQRLIDLRQQLLARERAVQFPVPPTVTPAEADADRRLNFQRDQEIRIYKASNSFPPAIAFSEAQPMIEQSRVFAILQRMPKGGALHVHSSAAGRLDWLVGQFMTRDDCHVCWPTSTYLGGRRRNLVGEIRFCQPGAAPPGFRRVSDVVPETPDIEVKLRQLYSLGSEDPVTTDHWSEFNNCFTRLGSALSNEPLYTAFFVDAFETFAADGVEYVELRTGFPQLYANDGTPQPRQQAVLCFQKALATVRQKYPDFDVRLIVSDWRGADQARLVDSFRSAVQMQKKYPDLIVGYDLVGKEDDASPTASLINVWPVLRQVCRDENAEFPELYLHDGENSWADDQNLIDAHIFNSRRIGHGLDLYLFPALEQTFRNEQIALEICPISNQILGYVSDLRLHPASGYIRRGLTCVLSSDDPLVFGYDGLTYDFWVAYMAWHLDLVTMRQLAQNAIEYSARTDAQKAAAMTRFEHQWCAFITYVNTELPEPPALQNQ